MIENGLIQDGLIQLPWVPLVWILRPGLPQKQIGNMYQEFPS